MLRNYFKVAVRNFVNQKYYSLLNTLGLALGIASCILIFLFVQDELSYEKSFEGHENTYRLVQDMTMGDHISETASVPFPTKGALLEDYESVEKAAFIYSPGAWGNIPVIKYKDDEYFEEGFVFGEPEMLEIFPFEFVSGNSSKVLRKPDEIILTESTAKKYFGDEEALGKQLGFGNFRTFEVVGVIKDLPRNTHLKFDMIGSFATFRSFFDDQTFFDRQWTWVATWLYFTVNDEVEAAKISDDLGDFVSRHYPEILTEKGIKLHIQKADLIHLTSNRELEFQTNGNMSHVYLFSFIAGLVLLIAIINFMNLSTARSVKRAKEVGLRKVMGAQREMLIAQFMSEAILTSLLSMVVAVGMIYISLGWFNQVTGKDITIELFSNTALIVGLLGLGLFVGVLAGSYPALVLSSHKPASSFKGKSETSSLSVFLRRILVISQFVVSISLMISIGIVYKQLNFIQNKDLGFDDEQIVMLNIDFSRFNQIGAFKNDLMANSEIKAVTLVGGSIPGDQEVFENAFVDAKKSVEEQQWFSAMFVGYDWEKIMDVEFIQGHSFTEGNSVDSIGYIINESAAKALGWGDDVIGRELGQVNTNGGEINQRGEVIGLVKDFHYRPLYERIKPLVIRAGGNKIAIKIQSDDLRGTMSLIEEQWNKTFEGFPLRYSFMDDNFNKLYEKERKFSNTIQYFAILAIFIAALGLLGLSAYATESRKKEIGIRKVNGASTFRLLGLLTKDFTKLVGISFLVSIPIAWYFGDLWLNNFAYKTNIDFSIILIAGGAAFAIAILTVSYHTFKAARMNPVESIRHQG